jgi:hypothetical protein
VGDDSRNRMYIAIGRKNKEMVKADQDAASGKSE